MHVIEFPGTKIEIVDRLEVQRWALLKVSGSLGAAEICFLFEPPIKITERRDGYTYAPIPLNTKIDAVETSLKPDSGAKGAIVLTVDHSSEQGVRKTTLIIPIPVKTLP